MLSKMWSVAKVLLWGMSCSKIRRGFPLSLRGSTSDRGNLTGVATTCGRLPRRKLLAMTHSRFISLFCMAHLLTSSESRTLNERITQKVSCQEFYN
jgi:hypothetical protein